MSGKDLQKEMDEAVSHSPEYRIEQLEYQVEVLKDMLCVALSELNLENQTHQVRWLDTLGPK